MIEIWRKKISPFPWSELSDFWSITGGLFKTKTLNSFWGNTVSFYWKKYMRLLMCHFFCFFHNPFLLQKTAMYFSCPSKNQAANCFFCWTVYSPVILLMLPPGSMHSGLQKGNTRDVSHQGSLSGIWPTSKYFWYLLLYSGFVCITRVYCTMNRCSPYCAVRLF